MKGKAIKGKTDGNDIPLREAFDWYKSAKGKGMATWYRNTGLWWDSTSLKAADGISLEEQEHSEGSLWSHYKIMIRLKKEHPALVEGKYSQVINDNDMVFSFLRSTGKEQILVVVNLDSNPQQTSMEVAGITSNAINAKNLFGDLSATIRQNKISVDLAPYSIQLWKLQ